MKKPDLTAFCRSALRGLALAAMVLSTVGGWGTGASRVQAQTMVNVYLPLVIRQVIRVSGLGLIETALQAGKIDYPTSLLYRAYAQFGDARLPQAYRGNYIEEDMGLQSEYTQQAAALPATIRAQLDPFMVRPDVATSAWSVYAAAHPSGSTQSATTISCIPNSQWASVTSSASGVSAKVWSICDGTYDADLTLVLGMIDDLWKPETDLMGQPKADEGGLSQGDGPEIDIYLLGVLDPAPQGRTNWIPGGTLGATYLSPPHVNNTSSGYILLPRELIHERDLKDTVAHEFFHVLQAAHNSEINTASPIWWFTEASAEWAGQHFVPETSDTIHGSMYSSPDQKDYQHSKLSMNVSGKPGTQAWDHSYEAYIWPFFMEQERGAKAIADVWREIEWQSSGFPWGNDLNIANKAVDKFLPAKDSFHRFAVRNLNLELAPNDPIYPRFVNQDPKFPDKKAPPMVNQVANQTIPEALQVTGPGDPGKTVSYNLPALLPIYYHYSVPLNGKQVEIAIPQAAGSPIQFDVLAKARGGAWTWQNLTGSTKTKLCDVEELYVVVSNVDLTPAKTSPASFTIRALDTPCTCTEFAQVQSVSGSIIFNYQHSAATQTDGFSISEASNSQFSIPQMSAGSGGVSFWGKVTGNGSIHNEYTDYTATPPAVTHVDGDGPLISVFGEDSKANLNINFAKCTYNFGNTPYLDVTLSSGGTASPGQAEIGAVRSDDFPLVIQYPVATLSGNMGFPAHSEMWGVSNSGNAFFPGQAITMFLTGAATEDNAGYASISWSFTAPIPGP